MTQLRIDRIVRFSKNIWYGKRWTLQRIPGKVRWDPALVPLNRRMRKRIQRASRRWSSICSPAPIRRWWDMHGEEDMLFLNIEIKRGMDLHNDHLFGFLEQLCQSGRVRGVYAGPPCRTVSLLRFQQEEGGPRPLRAREGEERFWLRDLNGFDGFGTGWSWWRHGLLATNAPAHDHRSWGEYRVWSSNRKVCNPITLDQSASEMIQFDLYDC